MNVFHFHTLTLFQTLHSRILRTTSYVKKKKKTSLTKSQNLIHSYRRNHLRTCYAGALLRNYMWNRVPVNSSHQSAEHLYLALSGWGAKDVGLTGCETRTHTFTFYFLQQLINFLLKQKRRGSSYFCSYFKFDLTITEQPHKNAA